MNSEDLRLRPFDLLAELGRFSLERGISLNDLQAVPKFTDSVGNALNRALSNSALLHGQRTEAMFEAMLVSLGEYSLLKAEDNGRLYQRVVLLPQISGLSYWTERNG